MTALVVRRIALPATVDVALLRSAWRHVRDGWPLAELGVVRWQETDAELHELAAAELTRAPAHRLRCTVLSTASRSELHVSADPARIDIDRLGTLLRDLAGTYRAARAGGLMLPAAEPVTTAPPAPPPPGPELLAAPTVSRPEPSAPPPLVPGPARELAVLRAAGRPHLHLHYPGVGAAAAYRQLVSALPSDWTITAVDDTDSAQDLDTEARRYLAALPARFAAPDLLGGWSMGGLVGLAAVRNHRAPPPTLLLVDSPPPGVLGVDGIPRWDEVRAFAAFLWDSFPLNRFRPLELDAGDDELGLALLSVALRRAGEEVPISWLTDWFAHYRRQLRLLAGYPLTDCTEVRALLLLGSLLPDQVQRWRQVIGAGLTIRDLGGGHFDLLRDRLAPEVARELVELMTTRHKSAATR